MITEARKLAFQKLIDNAEEFIPPEKTDDPSDLNIVMVKDSRPSTVAAKFEELSPVTHHYNSIDGYSIYSDNKYQQVRDNREIELHIRKFICNCGVQVHKKKSTEIEMLKQTRSFVKDVMDALAAQKNVHILPSHKAIYSFSPGIDPETTIAVKNGLLDLSNTKKPILRPFTPDFYTFNYLPIEYDPTRKASLWLNKCLSFYFTEDDVAVPDEIAQDVIHSWMKRWLLRIVNPHKICALIGKKRTGKGTIGRVTCALIGQANVSAVTIATLSGNHGLYGLMNKQLGIMWDASVTGHTGDIAKAVEALKNLSGQDNVTVNPKGRDTIDLPAMRLNLLMIANEPADLKDSTGALASRFTFLQTTQSFFGHENPGIEKAIIANELPGILNLVLAASDSIIEHPKSASLSQEYAEMTSPYTAFANDCCEFNNNIIPTDIVWLYYKDWCEKYKHEVPSAHAFKVRFFSAIEGIKRVRMRLQPNEIEWLEDRHYVGQRYGSVGHWIKVSSRPHCWRGIDIKEELIAARVEDQRARTGLGNFEGSGPD